MIYLMWILFALSFRECIDWSPSVDSQFNWLDMIQKVQGISHTPQHVVAASHCGGGSQQLRDWETGQNQGSFNVTKYREALEENLLQVAHNLRLVWRVTFQSTWSLQPRQHYSGLDFEMNSEEHLWMLEDSSSQTLPIQSEWNCRICQESRCAKLVAT